VPALADAQEMQSIEMDYSTRKVTDCHKIRTAGPATGVAVSTVGLGAGLALIPFGVGGNSSQADSAYNERQPGMIAAGATVAALSAAGLGVSIWRLVVKRREQRAQKDACAPVARRPFPGIRF